MANRIDTQTDDEKMAEIAAKAHICACEHGHHPFNACPGYRMHKGELRKCPCKECFCYICFREQRREKG